MRLSRRLLPGAFLLLPVVWGCHPYDPYFKGDFNAGAIDPFNFAPPYRTTGGVSTNQLAQFGVQSGCSQVVAGSCIIQEFRASINGTATGYFRFPFPPSQITTTQYPPVATTYGTIVTPPNININPDSFTPLRVSSTWPNGYVFDAAGPPDSANCNPPANYSYNPFRDDVHYDRQGNIFSSLPNANYTVGNPSWSYIPVVQEVPVTSQGPACQGIKSEATLLSNRSDVSVPRAPDLPDGTRIGQPDGKYLAWAIVDPGAPVLKVGETFSTGTPGGFLHQRYGWFNQYILAYLDGGYIPVGGSPLRLQTQRIYYPRSFNGNINNCNTAPTPVIPCALGNGQDVLQFPRSDPRYSPVCQVLTYPAAGGIANSAAVIEATYTAPGDIIPPPAPSVPGGPIIPTFIFCLQVLP
jgi:hypothetical protein